MDYTQMTLGVLLSSKDETVCRNAQSILKQLQRTGAELREEYFVITRLHRDDLENQGFNGDEVDDMMMRRIASKMSDAYLENSYWIDLDIIAEMQGVKKR